MIKTILFTAVAVLMFSGSALHASEGTGESALTQVRTTSPELATALQDLKTALHTPKTPLMFDNGAAASNCAEYSNLLAAHPPEESVRNAEIRAEYLVCDAIRLISNEPFLAKRHTLPANAAKALLERLDLRSFPSSLRNRTTDRSHTLKTLLVSGTVKTTQNSVEVETDEQFFSLQIAAVISHPALAGNLKTRRSEWIVWVGDEMKDGNYKSYRTLIVRPPTPSSRGQYTGSMYPTE